MKKLIFGSLFCIFMADISLCGNNKLEHYCSTEKSHAENERTQTAENPVQPGAFTRNYMCNFDTRVILFLENEEIALNIRDLVRDCLSDYVNSVYNGRQPDSTFNITRYNILPIIIFETTQMTFDNVFENIPYSITSCSVTGNPTQFLYAIEDFLSYKYTLCQVTGFYEPSAGSGNENATQAEELNFQEKQTFMVLLRTDFFQTIQQSNCSHKFACHIFNAVLSVLSARMIMNSFFVINPKVELHADSRRCELPVEGRTGYTLKCASASGFSHDYTGKIMGGSDTIKTQRLKTKAPFQILLIFYKPMCTKIEEIQRNLETSLCEQSYVVKL